MYRPAACVATLNPGEGQILETQGVMSDTEQPGLVRNREVQVTATSEVVIQPDNCTVRIITSSVKETAEIAKNSVSRRLKYILQTLHNNQVKVIEGL